MADNFDMKKFLVENKLGAYSKLREDIEEAKKEVSKEDKIQVIKEWIWYTCDEGQAKDDINKYNKMVDMYFASKDDVTKGDFKNIWNKVIEKWGVGDVGADSEGFYDAWKDIQTGTLVNPGQTYEGKKEISKEDMGHDIEDAEAMKQMDFLAEYEVIYVYGEDGKCYRKDDEGNYDQVDRSYCQRYAGSGVREEKEKVEETVDNRTLMTVEKIQDLLAKLKSNTATNSNIPTADKQGLLGAFQEIEELLEDVGADIEIEMDDRYVPNNSLSEESVRMFKSDNPEGDQLVLRFLKGVAQKFDYPVAQAAMFVKERIKKLGY